MIDGFRPRRRPAKLHSADVQLKRKIVVGEQHHAVKHFQPPTEVAAEEEQQGQTETLPEATLETTNDSSKTSWWDKLRYLDKKQWLIIAAVAVVVIGGGVAAFFVFHKSKPPIQQPVAQKQVIKTVPKPTTVPSKLTGEQVDPGVNDRTLTGVMIENSTDARPQSGLDEAGVVFEAVAEGGITRFLALYQDKTTPYLGPVRSVRPYYIQWALGFDAAIAHAGGSPEALQDMKTWHAKDLDQFANGGSYQRISTRFAPHNLYTSIAKLNDLEVAKGFGAASYTGFPRKADEPVVTPQAKTIDLTISGFYFNVHYDYDATTNTYKRSQAGAPHTVIDEKGTTSQLHPKVVIALVMSQGIAADDLHTAYGTIGSGHMFLFQDGKAFEGTWAKADNNAQITFTNLSGNRMALNPGQTWITVVNDNSKVTYAP